MWLQYPLPGQAGCQDWAQRWCEHVMPTLLGAGGEREKERERWGLGTWYCAITATNTVLSSARRQNSRRLTITALPGIGNALRELEHQWG